MMQDLAPLNPILVQRSVDLALEEDLGRAGDITTIATIPADAHARAVIRSRQSGRISGTALAAAAFRRLENRISFDLQAPDGARVSPGDVVATVEGQARAILSSERVALNYLGRLSGIATATGLFADRIAHTPARICCTRKTTPGLRILEKHAVRCGGGVNHRFGLDDAILIKDNHVAVAGSVVAALRAAKAAAGHLVKVEIEVDTLDQLDDVLGEGADAVLLDNMGPDLLAEAVRRIDGRMIAEASGNVTIDTVAAIAESGVDLISSGWITHSAPVLDLGLDIEIG
jgi:nicotinate-nucleotide pyrophosphorylase (carboxylating)